MLIVDGHLDLAFNALNHGRDLRLALPALRDKESDSSSNGRATVTFPELRRGGVGLVFGTLFVSPAGSPVTNSGDRLVYHNAEEAHRHGLAQLDYYHRMADEVDGLRLVGDLESLDEVVASHDSDQGEPLLGIVPLMEGADPVREPEELEFWHERGLRLLGLAWDDTRYSAGAWRDGRYGLTREGYHLLEVMADFRFILDLTHMSEKASLEALERYEGPVVATHSNARALVPGERQLNDMQIRSVGERDGVIGVVLYNSFLRANHRMGDPRHRVTLDHVVAHVDHICQLLGDAEHVGIGSDFDGGFGASDIPLELDSVADLPLLTSKLLDRGFDKRDVSNIMGGNWVNLLRRAFA